MIVKQVTKTYKTRYATVNALKDVSLNLPAQGMVFIVGVSGSGKTTLLNMLSGVDNPTTGDVSLGEFSVTKASAGRKASYRNSYAGLIFQDYNLIPDLDVYDNIKFPLELLGQHDYAIIDEVIKRVDIEEIKHSKVNEISSGQMQRVAIARALVKNSALILADEPTGNLDSKNEQIIFDLLKDISRDRLVIVITHNYESAELYADRIIEIEEGEILTDSAPQASPAQIATPALVAPKITLLQQLKLTLGFMRNNLVRTLSMALVLFFLPVIGGILTGYLLFDVGKSYRDFQTETGGVYTSLSYEKRGDNVYYPIEYSEDGSYIVSNAFNLLAKRYPNSTIMKQIDIYYPLEAGALPEVLDFKPSIDNIVVSEQVELAEGYLPTDETSILLTDYVAESFKIYHGAVPNYIILFGVGYDIAGIVKTDYAQSLAQSTKGADYRRAFTENLRFYNAFIFSEASYARLQREMSYFYDDFTKTVRGPEGVFKIEAKNVRISVIGLDHAALIAGTTETGDGWCLISRPFLENYELKTIGEFYSGFNVHLLAKTKAHYAVHGRASGVFNGAEPEIAVSAREFKELKKRISGSRALVARDTDGYTAIITSENVTNESFIAARRMHDQASGAKILIIQFLILFIVLMIAYTTIINAMTLALEKKKIGIKYSFGLNKGMIIVPYILESALYILLSAAVSTLLVKFVFPWIMETLVYTSAADREMFKFFYIGADSLLIWDGAIYAILLISITGMILKIVSKSPIEIIKDL